MAIQQILDPVLEAGFFLGFFKIVIDKYFTIVTIYLHFLFKVYKMARWASPERVAEYLGKSVSSVRQDIFHETDLGKLFYKIGSLRRADLDEVDALIKKCVNS